MIAPRRSRRWIWFFAILAVLAAGGVGFEVWFNVQQQLTPERLAAARAVWERKKPADYDVEYEVRRGDLPDPTGGAPQRYKVEVRGGRVRAVTSEGRPMQPGEHEFDSMDALFAYVARQLAADTDTGGSRTFVTADFAGTDGHIIHYVRSVMRTRERLEVTATLRAVEADGP